MRTYDIKTKGLTGKAPDVLKLLENAKATDVITLQTLQYLYGAEDAYIAIEQLSYRGLIQIFPDGIELIAL